MPNRCDIWLDRTAGSGDVTGASMGSAAKSRGGNEDLLVCTSSGLHPGLSMHNEDLDLELAG